MGSEVSELGDVSDPLQDSSAPNNQVNAIDDGLARAIGVPAFGVAIPIFAGLYGPLEPTELLFWLGQGVFIALAALIWQGNRWLLFKQREHLDWFAQPLRKLALLLFAIVCFTAPLTILCLLGWYRYGLASPVDAVAVRTVTLANVICVVFVTHAYETVFLIRDRGSDLLRLARLEQARTQAQLDALRAQVDPHFLFNALNTLNWLIETDPVKAREFNETLARVYRYLLTSRAQDLVPLQDELSFAADYLALMRIRFGDGFVLEGFDQLRSRGAAGQLSHVQIVPTALQILLENVFKHNQVGSQDKLGIRITLQSEQLELRNELRPRSSPRPSSGVGLANLARRVELVTSRVLETQRLVHDETEPGDKGGAVFVARVPLCDGPSSAPKADGPGDVKAEARDADLRALCAM